MFSTSACLVLQPKIELEPFFLFEHDTGHLLWCYVFPFNYAILLRGLRSREHIPYAMFIAEVVKVGILKLSPMITPDSYNLLMVENFFLASVLKLMLQMHQRYLIFS